MKDIQPSSLVDKANRQINNNKTAVIGFLVIVLVAFGSYAGYSSYKQKYEDKAQQAFFEAEKLHAINSGANEAPNAKVKPAASIDTTQVEEKLNSVILDFPKSTAAVQASLLIADIHIEKKDSPKAIATLERSYSNFSGHLIDSLMALKLSSLYEQNKQCDKALSVLQDVYNSKVKELKPEALLRQALCEETLGQLDKAKLSYQKLATEFSDSTQGQQAQKYLKVL